MGLEGGKGVRGEFKGARLTISFLSPFFFFFFCGFFFVSGGGGGGGGGGSGLAFTLKWHLKG